MTSECHVNCVEMHIKKIVHWRTDKIRSKSSLTASARANNSKPRSASNSMIFAGRIVTDCSTNCHRRSTILTLGIYILLIIHLVRSTSAETTPNNAILGNGDFTFLQNGSFIQIDAGREWSFNSKREISFRFKTKAPHGLLIYQTFDHNKLSQEEDQDSSPQSPTFKGPLSLAGKISTESNNIVSFTANPDQKLSRRRRSGDLNIRHLSRPSYKDGSQVDAPLNQLSSSTITATASEKLVNSLFSSSPVAAINGNNPTRSSLPIIPRDKPLLPSAGGSAVISRETGSIARNRLLNNAILNSDANSKRLSYGIRSGVESNDGSTILSSSTISSISASLYELYLKLENGRLKIMYEFGSRLNQTYCGKGLNDDRWHRVDLKVDPEVNQMVLILDQIITVEIALSQVPQEDESMRRNELVFTNSVLYLGGLNNNASIVRNVKQRLYLAQFIGCIGNIMLRTDQHTEPTPQPALIDRLVLIKRGCINMCDTDNYCLHKSACINYYTHTRCDCFGTNYEDVYCWQPKITSLSMFGYSTLVYRIYDWRDRHHSSVNRLSMQFRTLASDSILFFAYGDLSSQPVARNQIMGQQPAGTNSMSQVNVSNLHRPLTFQYLGNNNYLAISLSNGSLVVEVNFGDQPVIVSNLMYEKWGGQTLRGTEPGKETNLLNLADGLWHNVTFLHFNKQITLHLDDISVNYTMTGKNYHLYFDPSIYVGGIPNFLFNETRALLKPLNLRYRFVGCLKSVYFNQHNILLALKKNSPMVEYRDIIGRPQLDTCLVQEPNSLPLTLRSGKSYLTFQLSPNYNSAPSHNLRLEMPNSSRNQSHQEISSSATPKKAARIEFDYKTPLRTHFLAGGHLRDLSYHDLGGFWTLHARDDCQLYFTISSGLTFEPEQVLKLNERNFSCQPESWYRISISIVSGDKNINITRGLVSDSEDREVTMKEHRSYVLESSIELLHQVQIGGDLAKFGESLSIPFSGCLSNIRINGNTFDSRDFVTNLVSASLPNLNTQNTTLSTGIIQHDLISSRMSQGYVTLDSCQLVNACSTSNPCKNGGVCKINELGEPDCDCSRTGYTGKRCHFSIYKQSCHDLFLNGQRKSSYYLIDLDRNGPLKPIRVRCDMEDQIETSLSHNLPAEYFVRRSSTTDLVLDITYLGFHHMYTYDGFYIQDDEDDVAKKNQNLMLQKLIGQSTHCKQYIRYECRSAPLLLGNKTWFEAPYPRNHRVTGLDSSIKHGCACASKEKKCLNPVKRCNCDSGESFWSDDSQELSNHDEVGLTRIILMKYDGAELPKDLGDQIEPHSRLTLSDLKCYGTRHQGSEHEITFKTSDAYIEVPGWRRGDISFSFRTASNPPAIVLYQLATSRNHGYFRLTLVSDTRLLFEFIVNRRPRKLYLSSSHKLNNGEWQQVYIEYDQVNLRLTVNDDSTMIDLDSSDHLGTFEGPLFIGGAPNKYLVGDLSKRNGFTGCFRGLNINERSIDLNSYLSPSMPTVISGCQPSCTENLCQNGGRCIEYWGSYECECSNPIAHSGNNCEINLNTNSITFVTQESHYVQHSNESLPFPAYLTKNILLNIRTYQETALVLYGSDRFNNFIQLHKNGSSMVLTFNSNSTIILVQMPIDDETSSDMAVANPAQVNAPISLISTEVPAIVATPTISSGQTGATSVANSTNNHTSTPKPQTNASVPMPMSLDRNIKTSNTSGSGEPIQIKIERHRLRTTFYVNNNFVVIEKPMMFMTNFTQNPWLNPELELVRPTRSKVAGKAQSRIFLAAIDEHFSTRLPGFTGCIQGFSIDNQLFDFNRVHLTGDLRGEYKIGCKMHCDSFPCKNQGTCIENWMEDKIQCKCDTTSYVGRYCDEDIAAKFNGDTSYLVYYVDKRKQSPTKLVKKLAKLNLSETPTSQLVENVTQILNGTLTSSNEQTNSGNSINTLEISMAFSSDSNQSLSENTSVVQVLILMTQANSSRYFFLGLTSDGGLLIQEDYGSSMSLSRLIKKPDHLFNDGYRHMFKYTRRNHIIQIVVDHQAYLPTMSVITNNQANRVSKASLISVGTAQDRQMNGKFIGEKILLNGEYENYNGCISNLLIKINDLSIEPLSEAFGQNLESININGPKQPENEIISTKHDAPVISKESPLESSKGLNSTSFEVDVITNATKTDRSSANLRMLKIIEKDEEQEVENMDTIVARNVEQGKCASFKKTEISNEKRSINEPKYTPILDPRPVYMDPPRIKTLKRTNSVTSTRSIDRSLGPTFYLSAIFLVIVFGSISTYAYVLQIRYKSEKFRCDTPFFHRRDEAKNEDQNES